MAIDAGSIEYDVVADTSGLLRAEREVDRSTRSMASDLGTVESASRSTGTQVTRTAAEIRRASRDTARAMQVSSRGMGQAGIQVQQLVGQIQGGQNVMQAFAMQSADLGIVLGAPLVGVVASLSFALGSALAPALFNGKSAMEELEATTERLKATISLSSEGVAEYSDKMEKLAIVSGELVKTQLALTIIEQNKAFKQSAEVLNDATQSATGFINLFGSFDGVVTELTGKKLGKEGFDEARGALLEFKREVAEFNLKPSSFAADTLTESINRLAKAGGTATKEGQELLQLAVDQVSLFQQGKITLDQLNKSLESNGTTSSIVASKAKELVSALEMEAATLGFTDRALALHTAHLKGATQAEYDAINASFDKIESFKAEAEALKIKTAAEAKAAAKAKSDQAKLDREDASKKKGAETFAGGLIKKGLTPSEKLALDMAKLAELHAQSLINTETYEAAKTSIEQQQADAREQIKLKEAKAEQQRNNMILASSSQFFGGIADLLESSGDEQSGAYKAMFALSKGFAIAQAGLNLSTAISQASVLPFPSNIPAMAAAASSGAALVSAIGGASYAGGKQFGGGVNANSMYRVGEAGPEIFQTQSGQNMMIPGENGKVLSNSDATEAMRGGPMEVVVNNYGSPVDVKVNQTERQIIIDLTLKAVANQINSNQGVVPKALNSGSNYQPKANR